MKYIVEQSQSKKKSMECKSKEISEYREIKETKILARWGSSFDVLSEHARNFYKMEEKDWGIEEIKKNSINS